MADKSKGSILIVEDEAPLLASYARSLGSAGFEVTLAENGNRAIEVLRQRAFDAILSDISMPHLDGLGLLREVRKQDMDVPVLLMTGYPSLESAEQAVEHGAMRYLRKPIDLAELRSATEHAVRLCRVARVTREALDASGSAALRPSDRAGLEVAFEQALDRLWMAYQPIVSHSERRVVAFEALLRSGDSTLSHPAAILAAAERLGRLEQLGRRVREHVADAIRSQDVPCFINLHPEDLLDPELYAADAPLSQVSARVTLEITERASLDEIKDLGDRVGALRRLGYRLAVDDLGAGYAGLASIARLEPEVMKVDMALVRGVHLEPIKQKLVAAITSLRREMNVQVIAEGVETPAERDCLLSLGCDWLQGYLFAKPERPFPRVPAEAY